MPVSSTATFAPLPNAALRCFSTSQAPTASMPPPASKVGVVLPEASGAPSRQSDPHGRKFHCVRRQSPATVPRPGSFGTAEARAM